MFQGVFCPTITVLGPDGRIDYDAWGAHLDHLVAAGIDGILVFGSIGEFFAVPAVEKREAIKFAAERIAGRTKLLVGIGGTSQEEVLSLAAWSEQVGADALLVVSPYYFGPSDEAARRYFGSIARSTNLPVVLYNFPARTGSDLGPALVASLAKDFPNIVGMKDTVDTISHTRKVIEAVRPVSPEFSVLSGFDEYYLANRTAGGQGVLCGLTNVVPELFVRMNRSYEQGDLADAHACAGRISHLMAIYDEGDLFVAAIKEAVRQRGLSMSTRSYEPAVPLTQEECARIAGLLESYA